MFPLLADEVVRGPRVDQGDERGGAQGDPKQDGRAHCHAGHSMEGENRSLCRRVVLLISSTSIDVINLHTIHEEDAVAEPVMAT